MTVRTHAHALILGASSCIGRAAALALLEAGVADHFTLTYGSNEEATTALALELLENKQVSVIRKNLTLPLWDHHVPAFEYMLGVAADAMNLEISVAINAIGCSTNIPLEEQTLDGKNGWRSTFELHLLSPFLMTRSLVRRMAQKGVRGSIVHIGSSNGDNSYADYSLPYDLAKGALADMVRNLSETLARGHGIRINGVAPGWVTTSEAMAPPSEEERLRETAKIFLGRFATPKEIGDVVAFLSSEKASYIVGQTLRVDGGYR